ncbi:hypothetical protein Ami103574_02640 [Aminipila butyrica]|uniref:Uncharacterized protein n=1 Tax=Aminipila butyrica TaxID=433296 RepID=A0A858BRT6_9FIRM|nr:hypothetical protein [Aminipila butyrica]QIB68277.1 hypothetical protein Ami103574_02640 [Aminipila butyrica]
MSGMQYLDTAFSLLAKQSPIILFCIIAFWIQSHTNSKALDRLGKSHDKSLEVIENNYGRSLDLLKEVNNTSIVRKIKEK